MKLSDVNNLLKYMHSTYLKVWYNHTLPFKYSKVAEENEQIRLSEKMVQAIWNDSKFVKKELFDDLNSPVKVISTGEWNREPGPDFKNAIIEIDGERKCGDVEIHLSPGHWKSHGHHYDPAYKKVILHVVWEMKNHKFPPDIPHLELSSQLALSAERVLELTDLASYSKTRIHPAVECSEFISQIPDSALQTVFRTAGFSRLHRKSMIFRQKVTKFGFNQAFYMLLAEAHGYKSNREQFIKLAKTADLNSLNSLKTPREKQALLWGTSGLIPDITQEQVHPEMHTETVKLWNIWWKLRKTGETEINWNRSSQRPLNSPERRLAALSLFLEKCQYNPESIISRALEKIDEPKILMEFFSSLFNFSCKWEGFCNYKTKLKKQSKLIGSSRQLDIIVNVFLPAMSALLDEKDNEKLTELYFFYCSLPKSQDNHVIDIASHKFFIPPYRARKVIKKAVEQQGLMQLMQDFEIPDTPSEVISFWEELGIVLRVDKSSEIEEANV